ncbi:hypothetical protein JCM5353_001725 [Sporobolomyces roseus]
MAAINPEHRDRHSFAQSFSRGGYSLDVPEKQRPEIAHIDSKTKAALHKEWDDFKLPFTLSEAYNDYEGCRELISEKDCRKHKLTDRLDLTVYTLDDTHIAREQETVCILARLFDEIREMLFVDLSNGGNFETTWMALHADDRATILYSALSDVDRGLGESRHNCPDITVPRFARDDPKALILMLRQVVQSAIDHPHKNNYYPIECEVFDNSYSINRDPTVAEIPIERPQRGLQNKHLNCRHHYIAEFLHALLTICQYGQNSDGTQERRSGAMLLKPRVTSSPEVQKLQVMNKRRTNIADRASLALSPPRRHAYCDQECQIADYKQGGHRFVCGKPISEWSTDFGSTPRPSPPRTLSLQWLLSEIESKNKVALKLDAKTAPLDSASSPPKELIYIIRTTYHSLPPLLRQTQSDLQAGEASEEDPVVDAKVDSIPLRYIYNESRSNSSANPSRYIYNDDHHLDFFGTLKPFFEDAVRNTPPSPNNLNKFIRLLGALFGEEKQIGSVLKQVWEDFDQALEWGRVIDLATRGFEISGEIVWKILAAAEGFYDEIC